MTPDRRSQEAADRADLVYTYVLSQMGAKTVAEVLALWQSVPAGQAAQTASTWLARATELILSRRAEAEQLGLAYYRLVRALRTGSTIGHPLIEGEPKNISLELLHQEFEALVAEHTGEGSTDITAEQEPDSDEDSVALEQVNDLADALAASAANAKRTTETLLEEMAEAASAKVDAIPDDTPNGDAKGASKAMHLQHGAMVAAAGARVAMNGARNATNQASARDPRVIGWVRQSTTGTPCYFCAMLISRTILYKSDFTAGRGERANGRIFLGDGMFKFHDNCHCTALPVYSDADFKTNPKYAENRYYDGLWKQHIKDKFSGNDALNEWRKLLARIRADQNKPATTQAVAA